MTMIFICSRESTFANMLQIELTAAGFQARKMHPKDVFDQTPTVMLLDIDGCRLCEIPEDARACAVIAYTRHERRVPKGCRFVLQRPFRLETLFSMIKEIEADLENAAKAQEQLRMQESTEDLSGLKQTVVLCADGRSCMVGTCKIDLTEREFLVLSRLRRANGSYVSREELQAMLPKETKNLFEVYISRLRKKLWTRAGIQPIHTVRGAGYRLDCGESEKDIYRHGRTNETLFGFGNDDADDE